MPFVTIECIGVHPGGGRRLELSTGTTRLGRGAENDHVIEEEGVSRRHAEIVAGPGGYELRDVGSTNGVWFGEHRITSLILEHGMEFRIGEVVLEYHDLREQLTLISEDGVELVDNDAHASPPAVPAGRDAWRLPPTPPPAPQPAAAPPPQVASPAPRVVTPAPRTPAPAPGVVTPAPPPPTPAPVVRAAVEPAPAPVAPTPTPVPAAQSQTTRGRPATPGSALPPGIISGQLRPKVQSGELRPKLISGELPPPRSRRAVDPGEA